MLFVGSIIQDAILTQFANYGFTFFVFFEK